MAIGGSASRERRRAGPSLPDGLFNIAGFGNPQTITRPTIQIVTNPHDIHTAQRLQGLRYFSEGYVCEGDIKPSGVLNDAIDPYKDRSTYFTVSDEITPTKPLVVARQINCDTDGSFPVLDHMDLFPGACAKIKRLDASQCVEISGLAKVPGTPQTMVLLLYRAMWHHSLAQGHDKWIMASDRRLTRNLREMFGGALEVIGETQHYLGSPSDPMLLDSRHGLETLLQECLDEANSETGINKRSIAATLIDGLDRDLLPKVQRDLIAQVFLL